MKELAQEFIKEKGKEVVFIVGIIIVTLSLAFGYSYLMEGGDPFLPEGFSSTESRINRNVNQSLLITNEATSNLNDLLDLETTGADKEILAKLESSRAPLSEITPTVSKMAEDIERIASLMPEVRPRRAQKILSDAMTIAAILGQRLLTFNQQIATLYDGLEARAQGEESNGSYALVVEEVNSQVKTINSLYDQYTVLMAQFEQLTDD